ncbi:MAG: lactate utilization protein [Candidatus Tectomicrobia bacterium]|uniref:Lactate utilization protein n=1 Tax=Tectimicrobiota bacterium TaxID=2528274 RepID=A0A932FZQ4_UNCTE|nr:lactate utilization protein [Candidatus Tectomicrobia bacterium]
MDPLRDWYIGERTKRTLASLQKNGFEAKYFATGKEANEEILKQIPHGARVGMGGSMTLEQIGTVQALERREDITFLNPLKVFETETDLAAAMAKMIPIMREIYTSDLFLTGTNAISEKGQLFNIDGNGNRVGAMFFGPKRVIVVAGVNKIVEDLDEAVRRVRRYAAPLDAKRIGAPTPCAETGICVDCNSPARICNIFVTLHKRPMSTPISIFLVGEELGL